MRITNYIDKISIDEDMIYIDKLSMSYIDKANMSYIDKVNKIRI